MTCSKFRVQGLGLRAYDPKFLLPQVGCLAQDPNYPSQTGPSDLPKP